MPLKIVVTLNRIALCWPCSISPDADHASRYFLSACSFSRTCSSCLDLQTLLTALYLAIYLRLWQHYLNYNVLPKALTTLTILHCSMSMTTLASIHQYIHTSISNINNTATHTLTCNMINNNIACNIIEMFFIIHTLTDSLTHCACVLSRCTSKYILPLTYLTIIVHMSCCASKYILTLLTYILALLKPQMVHLLMP